MRKGLAVVVVVHAVAAGRAGTGTDEEKMQGKWRLTSAVPVVNLSRLKGEAGTMFGSFTIALGTRDLEVRGNRIGSHVGDDRVELKFKLDPTKTPKTIDATFANKDTVVFRGIYEVGKDSLRLCISGAAERPKAFKNTPDTPLYEFKRK